MNSYVSIDELNGHDLLTACAKLREKTKLTFKLDDLHGQAVLKSQEQLRPGSPAFSKIRELSTTGQIEAFIKGNPHGTGDWARKGDDHAVIVQGLSRDFLVAVPLKADVSRLAHLAAASNAMMAGAAL